MANADMCLDAARKAFPDNKELRVAYMIGFDKGFDRAMEQPEVDLEKEFNDFLDNVEGVPRMWHSNEQIEWAKNIARHFYELGQRTKYQQDRAEFAKLKAKEWQSGYDEGYMKGLNARKEE